MRQPLSRSGCSRYPQADLDKVCREINTRPRACLNGCMVADMFDEHID
ncbi:MAG: dephospho-CoA kinase [Propionibacteriaceae bacterium]|nr:dephospho-CoA kinase [Propionibacteriaceae bacterium]